MTARWPDPERVIIDRCVASLDLRSMKGRTCYRQVLHGFQDVAKRYWHYSCVLERIWDVVLMPDGLVASMAMR